MKEDAVAEKRRLAPYYFGGFSQGANTSSTSGVHSDELEAYMRRDSKIESSNGLSDAEVNSKPNGITA